MKHFFRKFVIVLVSSLLIAGWSSSILHLTPQSADADSLLRYSISSQIDVHQVVAQTQAAIEAAGTYRFETVITRPNWPAVVNSGVVKIDVGSVVTRFSGENSQDMETVYRDYVTGTTFIEFSDGSIEERTSPEYTKRDALVEFLAMPSNDWTLLPTESVIGGQSYILHRVLTGKAFEGFDLLETLWIDAGSFLPSKRELTSNDEPTFIEKTVYFGFGADLNVAMPQTAVANLIELLPSRFSLPASLVMTSEGTRTVTEITNTFPDPVAAAARFAEWRWQENAFRNFATPDGMLTVDVSAHRFGDEAAAAEALPYLAEGRALLLQLEATPMATFADQTQAIDGQVGGGKEISIYLRSGSTVFRITASSGVYDPTNTAIDVAEVLAGR